MAESGPKGFSSDVIALGALLAIGLCSFAYSAWSASSSKSSKSVKQSSKKGSSSKISSSKIDSSKSSSSSDGGVSGSLRDFIVDASKCVDDGDETARLRGYKTTKDGKVTTYFHRELSEADKALLGDNTPKPISSTATERPHSPPRLLSSTNGPSSPSSGSAWNAAGTWEEKSCSEFAKKKLRQFLDGSSFSPSTDSSVKISILNVRNVEGDASVTVVRGKRKYIYDLSCDCDWKMQIGYTTSVSGSVRVEDITGELAYETRVTVGTNEQSLSQAAKGALQTFIKGSSPSNCLRAHLKTRLDKILEAFQET